MIDEIWIWMGILDDLGKLLIKILSGKIVAWDLLRFFVCLNHNESDMKTNVVIIGKIIRNLRFSNVLRKKRYRCQR